MTRPRTSNSTEGGTTGAGWPCARSAITGPTTSRLYRSKCSRDSQTSITWKPELVRLAGGVGLRVLRVALPAGVGDCPPPGRAAAADHQVVHRLGRYVRVPAGGRPPDRRGGFPRPRGGG